MLENLEKKMVDMAESYADLIKKLIEESDKNKYVDSYNMNEINEGIKALNCAAEAINKIEECKKED